MLKFISGASQQNSDAVLKHKKQQKHKMASCRTSCVIQVSRRPRSQIDLKDIFYTFFEAKVLTLAAKLNALVQTHLKWLHELERVHQSISAHLKS